LNDRKQNRRRKDPKIAQLTSSVASSCRMQSETVDRFVGETDSRDGLSDMKLAYCIQCHNSDELFCTSTSKNKL
jgi:hypothetical protein